MKAISTINRTNADGKVGIGGAFVSLVLTVVVIILETRKSYSLPGNEVFLSCSETGYQYNNNNKIKTFLTCSVQNSPTHILNPVEYASPITHDSIQYNLSHSALIPIVERDTMQDSDYEKPDSNSNILHHLQETSMGSGKDDPLIEVKS